MCATWQATKVTRNARVPLSGETPLLNRKRRGWGVGNLTEPKLKYAVTGRAGREKHSEKAAAHKRRPEPRRCRRCLRPAAPPQRPARPRPAPAAAAAPEPRGARNGRARPPDTRGHRARAASGGATATAG